MAACAVPELITVLLFCFFPVQGGEEGKKSKFLYQMAGEIDAPMFITTAEEQAILSLEKPVSSQPLQ